MAMQSDKLQFYEYNEESPYDSFMKKHLQHYGYYTGKNDKKAKRMETWSSYGKVLGFAEDLNEEEYLNIAFQEDDADDKAEKLLNSNQVVYNVDEGKLITRLKEPRALFSINPDSDYQPPRWPFELEVISEKLQFLQYTPPNLEPFYRPTGLETGPTIMGEEGGGTLVYRNEPVLSPCFIKSRIGGSKNFTPCQLRLESEKDERLFFESRFESGNLKKAIHVGNNDYELWLNTDLYTSKHTQWYFFRVENTRANNVYRFTLVNFYKSSSLYSEGLRPLMYSTKNAKSKGIGWRRSGFNIRYYRSNKKYQTNSGERWFYSLTFQVTLEHDEDTVYFAHCYPYTYTDLVEYLQRVQDDPIKSQYCKQRLLCRSLAGNPVHLLTVSTPSQSESSVPIMNKRAIIVTARVHPGESNASWMMKGFLDYILGDSSDAKLLRDVFIFKIVPMLNPDGVIVGNYRCSLAGRDLNRNYKTILKDSFPSVWCLKEMVAKLRKDRDVVLYCDLHGHSRRQNVFIYGCEDTEAKEKDRLKERVFPAMLSKNAPDKFAFEHCKFKMQKSKEGTGRIVMYNLNIRNAFTLEASFCGSTLGALKGYHFNCRHFEELGANFCDTLLDYFDPSTAKRSGRLEQKVNINDLSLADLSDGDIESSDGGSDSSVSDGLPAHYEFMKNQMMGKRKKKRTRKERARRPEEKLSSGKPPQPIRKRSSFCDHCGSAGCPQQHGSADSNKRNKARNLKSDSKSTPTSGVSIRKNTSASALELSSAGSKTKSASVQPVVKFDKSDESKVSILNATNGSSSPKEAETGHSGDAESTDTSNVKAAADKTEPTIPIGSSVTDQKGKSFSFDELCSKHSEQQDSPVRHIIRPENQDETQLSKLKRLKSASQIKEPFQATRQNNFSLAPTNSQSAVSTLGYRSSSAVSDISLANQNKDVSPSHLPVPNRGHQRPRLPNRRLHSASPSYSFPVQIAPDDQLSYQQEWTQSQPALYISDLRRSYLLSISSSQQPGDESSLFAAGAPFESSSRPTRPVTGHGQTRNPQVYSEFPHPNYLNLDLEYDTQRRALIRRLESTNEVLPPLGSYHKKVLVTHNGVEKPANENDSSSSVVDKADIDSKLQFSDMKLSELPARNPRNRKQGAEIAQTMLQPTVTYSSGLKPPYPPSTNQNKPATISLHIAPLATNTNHSAPQMMLSKFVERHNRKQQLQLRQGKNNPNIS